MSDKTIDVVYDEVYRPHNIQFWEVKGAISYDKPLESPMKSVLHGMIGHVDHTDYRLAWVISKIYSPIPKRLWYVKSEHTRSFFSFKGILLACDIGWTCHDRGLWVYARNKLFGAFNKHYGLGITPSNFREVVFVQWQNQDECWDRPENHEYVVKQFD